LIVFDINSWHYKIILYVWGEKFFLDTSEIDTKKLMDLDSTKFQELSWKDYPRLEKPRTINFCPYCRAIVGSVISLPFVYLWRKFPHKPHKERTHEEIMKASARRNLIIRLIGGGVNVGFGIQHIIDGNYEMAAIVIGIGIGVIFMFRIGKLLKPLTKRIFDWQVRRMEKKLKNKKPKKERKPSLLLESIKAEHDKICPPVFFIDKTPQDMR